MSRTVALGRSLGVAAALAGALLGPAAAQPPLQRTPRPPTVADPIRGLDLWRGAKVGMRVDQVRALFPAATPPPVPSTLTGGEVDRLQLAGVRLAGQVAVAHFFFKDAELVSVELSLPGLRPAASAANVETVRSVAAAFTARYGQAYDCGDRSFGDVTAYECKWLDKPLSIRLWYMDTAGQAPLFYLAYRQADDPGYNL